MHVCVVVPFSAYNGMVPGRCRLVRQLRCDYRWDSAVLGQPHVSARLREKGSAHRAHDSIVLVLDSEGQTSVPFNQTWAMVRFWRWCETGKDTRILRTIAPHESRSRDDASLRSCDLSVACPRCPPVPLNPSAAV